MGRFVQVSAAATTPPGLESLNELKRGVPVKLRQVVRRDSALSTALLLSCSCLASECVFAIVDKLILPKLRLVTLPKATLQPK